MDQAAHFVPFFEVMTRIAPERVRASYKVTVTYADYASQDVLADGRVRSAIPVRSEMGEVQSVL